MTDMKKMNEQELAIAAGGAGEPQYTDGGIHEDAKKELQELQDRMDKYNKYFAGPNKGLMDNGEEYCYARSLANGMKGPKIG